MPKPRKFEQVRCTHFNWRLTNRGGKWYADGRSNTPDAGRHSLATSDKSEALKRLPEWDRVRAEDLGLVPRSAEGNSRGRPLPLAEGRKLYETHIARPRVTGGVRESTKRSYRSVFDKFIPFATAQGATVWNGVTANLLNGYAGHLEDKGYAHKTLVNELTTLKQAVKWMIQAGHLKGVKPIELKLRKAESLPAYCYRPKEVTEMLNHCRTHKTLGWVADVIITLACTGLRIAELVSLRWADIDLESKRLTLTDETGRSVKSGSTRRKLKSGRSRSFPIHPDLLDVLKRLPRKDAYVFHGPNGGQLNPNTVRCFLVRDVIEPLTEKFPTPDGQQGFKDGRLHSFRHYFCSTCANNGVPERIGMTWLGHADSEMIRNYYHLHDEEAQRRMKQLDFLGDASGWSAGDNEDKLNKEDVEPRSNERSDNA